MRNTHFRPGLWLENSKKCKMRHKHCLAWNMARTTEKSGKWNTNTVRPGICPKEPDKVRK